MCGLQNTLSFSDENLMEIDLVVSKIWPGKDKSWGARLFRQVRLFSKISYGPHIMHDDLTARFYGRQSAMIPAENTSKHYQWQDLCYKGICLGS